MLLNENILIAATPRSGSFLFCDVLNAAEHYGRSFEFAPPDDRANWQQALGFNSYRAYLENLIDIHAGANGNVAIKFMGFQFKAFLNLCRHSDYSNEAMTFWRYLNSKPLRIVHLRRANLIAQATSWAILQHKDGLSFPTLTELIFAYKFIASDYLAWNTFLPTNFPSSCETLYYEEWTKDWKKNLSRRFDLTRISNGDFIRQQNKRDEIYEVSQGRLRKLIATGGLKLD